MKDATTGWATQKTRKGVKVWVARWIKENGKTGERKCKSQTEARKVAAQMTAKVAELKERQIREGTGTLTPKAAGVGGPAPLSPRTHALRGRLDVTPFSEVVASYEAALHRGYNGAPPLKANTLKGYKKHHSYWDGVFANDRNWPDVARHVRDELVAIAEDKKSKFGRKTAKAKFDQLKRVCAYAVAEGMLKEDPVVGQEIKLAHTAEKIRSKAIKAEQAYRPEEIQALVKAADELCEDTSIDARSRGSWRKIYRPLLHLLINSGVRISEARALTRANVDFENGSIHIDAAADEFGDIDTPKSANAVREIPLPPATMDHLKHAMNWHRHALLFASSKGTVRAYNALRDHFLLPLCERAEVRNRGFHGFRHHLASQYIASGADVLELSKLLGHHTPSFTLDVYAHFFQKRDSKPLDLSKLTAG